MRIYLDNAATTALDPQVLEAMMPFLTEKFGNPSSVYSYGRETRLAVEMARKTVARLLGAHPSEIFFTSCGTESSNTAIINAVRDLGCKRIITSPLEHHAVLHTVEYLHKAGEASLSFVRILPDGHVDMEDLRRLLAEPGGKALVTLMHANNEIGNMIDLQEVGSLCMEYGAIFHSDTVQTVGHFPFKLSETPVHFITGSAHKFHGPKGVGLLYIRQDMKISPFIHGGGQERNMRAGTENIYGIVGFAKALELAMANYEEERHHIEGLKQYMLGQLKEKVEGLVVHGDPEGRSLYAVLNVGIPKTERTEMLLFNMDVHHICVSGGSACTSGADAGSHVIRGLGGKGDVVPIRFSFSKWNTRDEIDLAVAKLLELC